MERMKMVKESHPEIYEKVKDLKVVVERNG
jgi:hypothetical protein